MKKSKRVLAFDLTEAVLGGALADIERLIQAGANVNACKRDGFTPLMYAMIRGDPKVIGYLIDQAADVNRRNEIGQTALMIAAQQGYVEILKQLVAAGANIHAVDDDKRNVIHWATTRGDFPEVVSLLVAWGADYNARDIRGITPLMSAALMGFAQCTGILLTVGADEKVKFRGKTAYEMATEKGHTDVCETMRTVLQNRL